MSAVLFHQGEIQRSQCGRRSDEGQVSTAQHSTARPAVLHHDARIPQVAYCHTVRQEQDVAREGGEPYAHAHSSPNQSSWRERPARVPQSCHPLHRAHQRNQGATRKPLEGTCSMPCVCIHKRSCPSHGQGCMHSSAWAEAGRGHSPQHPPPPGRVTNEGKSWEAGPIREDGVYGVR
jgi:hypothetical protein